MQDSDNEFGDVDDEDLMLAASQAEKQLSQVDEGLQSRTAQNQDVQLAQRSDDTDGRPQGGSERLIVTSSQEHAVPQQSSRGPATAGSSLPSAGVQGTLRQTVLFGAQAGNSGSTQPSNPSRKHNWPLANKEEPPTHHRLEKEELQTWVYPTNLGSIRDYQYNIVARGLFHNLLVALPTGLGKTFIAAAIMLNWFRWTSSAQIVFVAPTKPLVKQQVDACFTIAGIPRSTTTMLTGNVAPGLRAEVWQTKRVFFMTPQTIVNDLKTGLCDPKRVVLLVVDEAHRATGSYAYVEVVKFLRRFNTSFRVIALTATPGSTVESVQEVIDGLGVSRVEIRTEQSLDIRQYVHPRKVETVLFENSEEMSMIMKLYSKGLQPLLDKVVGMNAHWGRDPLQLTPYGCTQSRQKWMAGPGRNAHFAVKGMVNSIFSLLASLAHATELLKFHGIVPFYHKLVDFRKETMDAGEKGSRHRRQVTESEHFKKLMWTVQAWVSDKAFVGHPKLEYLQSLILTHFLDASEGRGDDSEISTAHTRIMVFAHYRDSAEQIVRVLKRNEPMIRPHVFVGQANSKGSDGMGQKQQLSTIEDFKNGIFNTLVATSIGEEGLDIGEVDLIICYDASASPIRMLQRMGRTGRKRAGKIVITLMTGKEETNFTQAKDSYEKMQALIESGSRFNFHDNLSPRIVPRDIQPAVDKKVIDIPLENTQDVDSLEPRKRGRIPKRPPKKFHMPDNVHTGFRQASRLQDGNEDDSDGTTAHRSKRHRVLSPTPELTPPIESVFLTSEQQKYLEINYLRVGGDDPQTAEPPRLDAFPALQRKSRPVGKIQHGKFTKLFTGAMSAMYSTTKDTEERYEENLDFGDKKSIDAQIEGRTNFSKDSTRQHGYSNSSTCDLDMTTETLLTWQASPKSKERRGKVLRRKSRQQDQGGDDESLNDDDSEDDESMADFIDDSTDFETGSPKPSMIPTPAGTAAGKEFNINDSDTDEDFPNLDILVGKRMERVSMGTPSTLEDSAPSQRRAKRKLVQSDSDE